MIFPRPLLALSLVLALPPTAGAASPITISPGDNVQEKLNSANDGDIVHFKPGTYTGTFTVAKNITVEGEGGVFLINPASAAAATLTFTGGGAKLTDVTVLSSVADAVVLGQGVSAVQRAELVSLKSGNSALSVAGSLIDGPRDITVDSSVLAGTSAFSASLGVAAANGIAARFRHVTAIGNITADASQAVGTITEVFSDSIIRGTRPPAATADPARNSVASTATDLASLFVSPGAFNFHLRADATTVIDKGQITSGEPDKDLDGQARTSGPASDYGADEFVNQAPTAVLAAPTGKVRQGIPAAFDAAGSKDPEAAIGGGIAGYHWDFGDGTAADTMTPTTTHAFPDRKTYNVRVTVTDRQGLASAASTPVSVDVIDGTPPTVRISQPKLKQRITLYKKKTRRRAKVTFFGKAADDTLLDRVYLALRPVGVKGTRCRWFDGKTKLVAGVCANPVVLTAVVTGTSWRYALPLKAELPRGPYLLAAISVDASGLPSTFETVAFRLR